MATPFAEALMSSMTAQLDPMNATVAKFATNMAEAQETNTVVTKAEALVALSKMKASITDDAIVGGFEKLIARLTK